MLKEMHGTEAKRLFIAVRAEGQADDIAAALFERGYTYVIAGKDETLPAMLAAARNSTTAEPVAAPLLEQPLPAMRQRDANTSIRRMRQFWIAWCVAVLLLGAAVVGFGTLFALSEAWPHWAKIGGRVAAGLLALFAVCDAYRIAARGTAAFQEVLAQNLASIVTAELERLHAAAAQRRLILAAKDDPKAAGALGLSLTSWSFDGEDVRSLLGNPTEAALREVLASIEAYNLMIDALAPGDAQAEHGLARQIEEISAGINRAMQSVAGRLDAYRPGAAQ